MKIWQAVIIDDEATGINGVFGITNERMEKLADIGDKALDKFTKTSDMLEYITGECNNINEAIYMSFMLGRNASDTDDECGSCPIRDIIEIIENDSVEDAIKKLFKDAVVVKVSRNKKGEDHGE